MDLPVPEAQGLTEYKESGIFDMSDQLIRAISRDGFVKAAAVSTRELTERARQIHKTLPVATAALGRTLAAASMMGNALKEDGESVTLQIKGAAPWDAPGGVGQRRQTSGGPWTIRRWICLCGPTASWT